MPLTTRIYHTDMGKEYSFLPISFFQVNPENVQTEITFDQLVPESLSEFYLDFDRPCPVIALTPRRLNLFTFSGAQFRLDCPIPFNQAIATQLQSNGIIKAYELVGERIRYSTLKKIL